MTFFTLEYKSVDSKGREKNSQFVGVYKNIVDLELAKQSLLKKFNNLISFQVYSHTHLFNK